MSREYITQTYLEESLSAIKCSNANKNSQGAGRGSRARDRAAKMGGGEAGSCFSMPDSIAIQVLVLVITVVSVVVGDVAVSLVVVNVPVDALVNHLMKCKQTRCDVIPFDMTGNNNDTGVSHNLQFFIINFNIVLYLCHHHH